jgi:hypothetical protein
MGGLRNSTAPPTATASAAKKKAASCGPKCGTERWDVKTLTDPDESQVNFTPKSTTVATLTAIGAPDPDPEASRLNSAELQTWVVHARLVGYKHEGDRDFHIVLADLDDPSNFMIVEIPDPQCAGACSSPKLAQFTKARQVFAAAFPNNPPASGFDSVQGDVEVQVTGVGLFDFFHGQTGVATNCIELHPVLDFKFITPGPYTVILNGPGKPPPTTADQHQCIAE